jgi:hypothetical protein
MQASQAPDRIPLAFATSGTKNVIPEQAADITNPNDASYEAGFPPVTMAPVTAGGIPPNGADFNGILFALSALGRWQSAGGQFKYDADFATDSNVGGYPKGAILQSSDGSTLWLSTADNNTTDPDSGTAANWVSLAAYGIAAVAGLTNLNVTLTPAQYSKTIITLAGTLTGNVQIILPTSLRSWTIINNCTGAFSVTVKTASGSGVVVPGSGGIQEVYGDGTNIVSTGVLTQTIAATLFAALSGNAAQTFQVAAATAAAHALNLGQFTGGVTSNDFISIPMLVAGVKRNLIIQWGTVASQTGRASITPPVAFPNAVFFAGGVLDVTSAQYFFNAIVHWDKVGSTLSSLSFVISSTTSNIAASNAYSWFAVGY